MRFLLLIISTLGLVSCTTQSAAPVQFGNQKPLRTTYSQASSEPKEIVITEKIITKKVIVEENELDQENRGNLGDGKYKETTISNTKAELVNLKTIYYEVQKGDNIEEIAERYETSVHDIAKTNDLLPPYKLDKFQILKIKVSPKFLNKKTRQEAILEPVKSSSSSLIESTSQKPRYTAPVASGRVIKGFGQKLASGSRNKGIDIKADEGSNVVSVFDGTVVTVGNKKNYGNFIIVKDNATDVLAAYCHLQESSVSKGDIVARGDTVGYVGKTGDVDEAELYFALKKGETSIDPSKYVELIKETDVNE